MTEIKLANPLPGQFPITQKFGANPSFYKIYSYPGHNGVDFGCPNNTLVRAAEDGTVTKASWDTSGYGNLVIVQHEGYQTYYAHLNMFEVIPGDNVKKGQLLANSDNTGNSTGPHLHFGVRLDDHSGSYKGFVDPLPLIKFDTPQTVQPPLVVKPGDWVMLSPNYDYVNIRPTPEAKPETPVLGTLKHGVQLEVIQSKKPWVAVKVWIHSSYLKKVTSPKPNAK